MTEFFRIVNVTRPEPYSDEVRVEVQIGEDTYVEVSVSPTGIVVSTGDESGQINSECWYNWNQLTGLPFHRW